MNSATPQPRTTFGLQAAGALVAVVCVFLALATRGNVWLGLAALALVYFVGLALIGKRGPRAAFFYSVSFAAAQPVLLAIVVFATLTTAS